ncbi:hypothetical protein [Alteromonas macleodii]|uniref:hypothetical protein n=1 Tax=Alteromonas macleodii TaxID=28108 RepID=UPI00313FFF04
MLKKALCLIAACVISANTMASLSNAESTISVKEGKVSIEIYSEPSTIVYLDGLSVITEGGIASTDYPEAQAHRFIREDVIGYRGGLNMGVNIFNVKEDELNVIVKYKSCDLVKEVCFPPQQDVHRISKNRLDTHSKSDAPNLKIPITEVDSLRKRVNERISYERNPYLLLVEKGCLQCKLALDEVLPTLPSSGMDLYIFEDAFTSESSGYLADIATPEGIMIFKINNDATILDSVGGLNDKKELLRYFL